MIRPFTLICAVLAMVSGLYLYQSKHESQLLDRKIATIVRSTDDTRTRIGMLRADYQLLNDPTRLQDLADKKLTLRPIAPTQFTTMAELGRRLPPVDLAPHPVAEPIAEPDAGLFVTQVEPAPVAPALPKLAVAPPGRAPTVAPQTPLPAQVLASPLPIAAPKPIKPTAEPAIQTTALAPQAVPPRRLSPPQYAVPHSPQGQSPQGQSAPGQSALGQSALGQPALGQSALGQSALGQSRLGQSAIHQTSAIRPVSDARTPPAFASTLGMARTSNPMPTAPVAGFANDGGGGR